MLISIKKKNNAIPAEGNYDAEVSSVAGKPNDTEPTKIVGGFKVAGYEKEITKDWPVSLIAGSPLRTDIKTILGRDLTTTEAEQGFELSQLVGQKCQVVVFHKSGSGGRPKPSVSIVLSAT